MRRGGFQTTAFDPKRTFDSVVGKDYIVIVAHIWVHWRLGAYRSRLGGTIAMHALIIEDQIAFAMLLEDELRELGYTSFDVVDTEAAAIESAADCCPDLITADHRLASGSGVDAIRAICADRHIPFVFITSYRNEVREHFPDATVVGKPFWPPTLHEAIGQAVALSRPGTGISG